jgi:hypothetical protein
MHESSIKSIFIKLACYHPSVVEYLKLEAIGSFMNY